MPSLSHFFDFSITHNRVSFQFSSRLPTAFALARSSPHMEPLKPKRVAFARSITSSSSLHFIRHVIVPFHCPIGPAFHPLKMIAVIPKQKHSILLFFNAIIYIHRACLRGALMNINCKPASQNSVDIHLKLCYNSL